MHNRKETSSHLLTDAHRSSDTHSALSAQLSRRKLLQLAAGMVASSLLAENVQAAPYNQQPAPSAPDANNFLYMPQIETEGYIDHSQMIFEAIQPYYPNLEQEGFLLLIGGEETQPGIGKSIRAWKYWLDRLYQPYQSALQTMANAGIENEFFQSTNRRFYLDLMTDRGLGSTSIEDDENGEVIGVEVYAHYGFPGVIVGEWLHLINKLPDLERGLSRTSIEGASTLVHYEMLIKWLADNVANMTEGTPENAVVMPVFERISETEAQLHTDPSLQQFHDFLTVDTLELLKLINESENYLHTFTTIEEFGVHKKLQGGMQLLTTYAGDLPGNEYHVTIEDFANRYAREAHEFVQTDEDIILLSGLAIQGKDYPMDRLPEPVRQSLQAWYDRGLLYNSKDWSELLAKYSQVNVADEGLAIHPIITAKAGEEGDTSNIRIFAYVSRRWQDGSADYLELPDHELPTAKLYFQHPDGNNVMQWWNLDLTLTPLHEYGTFVFDTELPTSARVPGSFFPVSLEGKQLVLNVNIDTIAGVPMTFNVENFELIGHYQAAQSATTESGEAPIAEPATAPENTQAQVSAVVNAADLTAEQQAYLQKPDSSENEVVIFGPDANPPKVVIADAEASSAEDADGVPQIYLGEPPAAWREEEWLELQMQLQAILDKNHKKAK